MRKRLIVLTLAGCMMLAGSAGAASLVSLWNLEGDLTADIGTDLTEHPGQTDMWHFHNTSQYGDWAKFPDGQHGTVIRVDGDRLLNGFHAVSDLSQQYEYTVVMDLMYLGTGWTGNAWRGAGGMFDAAINGSTHQVYQGAGWQDITNSGSGVYRDTWQRFVYTINTGNEVAVYQNGSFIASAANGDVRNTGSWWYGGVGFNLVYNLANVFVSSAAIYDGVLTANEIAALGGPTVAGIPEPATIFLVGLGAVSLLRRRR